MRDVKVKKLVDVSNELIELLQAEMGLNEEFKITAAGVGNMTGEGLVKLTQLTSQLSKRSLDLEDEVWLNIQLNQIKD